MDVFFYINKQDKDRVIECGLNLNEWADRKIHISGSQHMCIHALLNPKDEPDKYNNDKYIPLKIHVNPKATIVAEGVFYNDAMFEGGINKLYNESIITVEKYIFGTYRRPECLLTGTVPGKYLEEMDKLIDVPILYSSSEELYILKQIEHGREMYPGFEEKLLYRYYDYLHNKGLYKLYTTADGDYTIFESQCGGHVVSVKKL